jgi:single-strand selective monofunctional uracil DNA glycosylase
VRAKPALGGMHTKPKKRAASARPRASRADAARFSQQVAAAARDLAREIAPLRFGPPVACVYNPLDYARRSHARYVASYAGSRKRVIFLGMNPGPFGMAQTGVPFGEVGHVRDWLGIETPVGSPPNPHPKRPIEGFACPRSEVSGARLWGAVAAHWGSPERFFARHYVANYCPLLFLEASGRNRTPDHLPQREQAELFTACDRHLARLVDALAPEWVIGVGAFAAGRAQAALGASGPRIGRITHPSPANPRAARDWAGTAARELAALGLCSR